MRARVTRFILLAGLLWFGLAGCSSSSTRPGNLNRVQPISSQPRAGNVYLLRGFIGIFSTGIDDLTRQINQSGIRAHVYQDDQWSALARRIRREYRDHPRAEPLVLVGHSYGADDVIRIARELDEAGIQVDLLITLDPVTPPPVPKNVRHALNLYQSNGVWDALPWLRGVAVKAEPSFAGRLDNFDLRSNRPDLLEPGTGHFNIEKKAPVHEEVIGTIIATCPPRQTWLAMRERDLLPARELARRVVEPDLQSNRAATELDRSARQAGHRGGD